jgi:hypothetical protein
MFGDGEILFNDIFVEPLDIRIDFQIILGGPTGQKLKLPN